MGCVQYRASHLQHVCHEGLRRSRARSVDDKRNHCGKGGRKGFSDDGAGGRPGEDLNLAGRVCHDERRLWFSLLFAQLDDLDTDRIFQLKISGLGRRPGFQQANPIGSAWYWKCVPASWNILREGE